MSGMYSAELDLLSAVAIHPNIAAPLLLLDYTTVALLVRLIAVRPMAVLALPLRCMPVIRPSPLALVRRPMPLPLHHISRMKANEGVHGFIQPFAQESI